MFAHSSYSVAYPFPDMSQCLTVLLQVACHMMNYLQHLCGAVTFSNTVVVFFMLIAGYIMTSPLPWLGHQLT